MDKLSKKIPLLETFGPTFQGEGALAGTQTYFYRFGLCDYECKMCDSLHAVLPESVRRLAEWLPQDEILQRLEKVMLASPNRAKWVTLSGGNPCIHNLDFLVDMLRLRGLKINVETQGTKAPEWLKLCHKVTVSPKGPGMGEVFDPEVFTNFIRQVPSSLIACKIVVFDARDLEFAADVFSICRKYGVNDLYLSLGNPYPPGSAALRELESEAGESAERERNPELFEELMTDNLRILLLREYRLLCEDILKDPRFSDVRFFPQLHVLTWGNKAEV